ncbi:MAG TPA: medium chain dehydrogenase/reductase family protein [Solirubrobacterales bacterium]|nr:medium chain dehydrogenase/reductase family protein [Solirubrobacterales bacterium]
MRAVVITRHGGPEVLRVEERPTSPPGPGEVAISVRAAGINFADTMARCGTYPDAPPPPCVIGYEVAGEVESVGAGVESVREGDRVCAATRFGGYSEHVTVPAGQVFPLPQDVPFEQGAAFPVNYGTAYAALVIMGGVRAGDRVLIHSAGGGVGTAATQVAKARGAEVFGTASASKHDAIRANGVDHAIDYRSTDFEDEVRRITGGDGVDVIIDALGPASFRKDYRLLRPGGRLVMYGLADVQTGDTRNVPAVLRNLVRMPFATVPWWKSLSMMNENKGVFGLNMLHWWDQEGDLERVTEPLAAALEAGELEPVVAEAFPFDRAGDAHRFLQDRRNIGKVVLVP